MRDFKPFNPEKKLAQGTSRMDTTRRLAKQPDGGTTSSDYGYGPGKPVGPDTGVESLQHSSNRFLDGLQQMTQKARMDNWQFRQDCSNYDSSQWHRRQDSNWQTRVEQVDEGFREIGYEVERTSQYEEGAQGHHDAGTSQQREVEELSSDEEGAQGHHDAGTSQQREVELADLDKHKILKRLQNIVNRVSAGKKREVKGFNEKSHFVERYKIISKYRQNSCKGPQRGIKNAYKAYEEIVEHYNEKKYNTWENGCCKKMLKNLHI